MNFYNNGDKVYTVGDIDRLERENAELKSQVEKLQQSLLKCAELVNVDGGTAIDWLIDNHHDLRQQAEAGE